MKVYISGKIGEEVLSDKTFMKFMRAEDALTGKGFDTFNPTTSGFGKKAETFCRVLNSTGRNTTWYSEVLKLDIIELSNCDAIYLLQDWKDSPGAKAELAFAQAIGMRILCESMEDAFSFNHKSQWKESWIPIK